jgi:hypothetical protein
MDVGSTLKHVVASTMTLDHDITTSIRLRSAPKPKSPPPTCTGLNIVRVDPYAHSHHIKVPKNFVYIQYGCGIQSEACCSLNNDIATSLGLRSAPKTPKPTPHLHRPSSVRVDPYVHSHHINVPKYFVNIQYGCWIQYEACCSLKHDITRISPGLRSGPNIPKSTPHLVDPYVHSHHI